VTQNNLTTFMPSKMGAMNAQQFQKTAGAPTILAAPKTQSVARLYQSSKDLAHSTENTTMGGSIGAHLGTAPPKMVAHKSPGKSFKSAARNTVSSS